MLQQIKDMFLKAWLKIANSPIKSEIVRLRTPIILVVAWCGVFGLANFFQTAVLMVGFVALSIILGHIAGKELFFKYKWDAGERLNEAWNSESMVKAILATAMLMARVTVYVAVVVSMAIALLFLRG